MEVLQRDNLKEGEVYVTVQVNPDYLFLRGKGRDINPHITPQGWYVDHGDLLTNFGYYRLATQIEKEQMLESHKRAFEYLITIQYFNMLISKLPEPIKTLAEQRRYTGGRSTTEDDLTLAFSWASTKEKYEFWDKVDDGKFEEYNKIYPVGNNISGIINNYIIF